MAKSKLMNDLKGRINQRQEKVLLRMFAEGPKGFSGGLSAENYMAITKTSSATATRDLTDQGRGPSGHGYGARLAEAHARLVRFREAAD